MQAARQLAQLLETAREVVLGGRQGLAGGARIVVELRARHPELERHRDEPLLRAVVQVALQAAPLGVAHLHELGA